MEGNAELHEEQEAIVQRLRQIGRLDLAGQIERQGLLRYLDTRSRYLLGNPRLEEDLRRNYGMCGLPEEDA